MGLKGIVPVCCTVVTNPRYFLPSACYAIILTKRVSSVVKHLYQAPAMLHTSDMTTKRGYSKPLPAAVELGRRGGKARVAQLSHEELQELGRRGGQSRAKRLSKEQRREIARKAVQARWEKARRKKAAEGT